MIASAVQANEGQRTFSGLLLESSHISNNVSLALLFGRLLIAVLFLYVGLSELHRLLFQPFTPYLPGDGHDVVWPKAVELVLSLPFILGCKMETVSRLLAASLVLEALYAWSWWTIPGEVSAKRSNLPLSSPLRSSPLRSSGLRSSSLRSSSLRSSPFRSAPFLFYPSNPSSTPLVPPLPVLRPQAHSFAHHRRAIHYREHFVTNIATAGGLLLLQKIGGGKYTVDELMKKSD